MTKQNKKNSTKPAKQPKKSSNKSFDRRWLLSIVGFVMLSLVGGWVFADWFRSIPTDMVANYVGRESCIECHQTQHELFHGSHHDKAMDLATDSTVLADFNEQTLEYKGLVSRFFRDGKKFMVHTEGPDGTMQDFEVKYVFGVEPLQQYMVELKPARESGAVGTVQVLRLSWDTENSKWFYLSPPDVDDRLSPDDPLHWTGITQNWNSSCAFCHSTDLQKNFDVKTQTYNTTFSEIDVSCEACHGPGSLHVDLAKRKSFFWDRKRGMALHKLKTDDNVTQIETCAPCHSRRRIVANDYVAGCNFNDFFDTTVMEGQLYHCDGQIRDEVYVYGSYIQSKMYHQNIKCTDCHDPHSTKIKYKGNQLCTSCHQHPASKYDDPSHHHHLPGSTGSLCVNCHMPETTYMDVDPRRDHSLRVPLPDQSLKTSAPNACTSCHIDTSKITDAKTRAKLKQYLDWIILRGKGNEEVTQELARIDQQMADAVAKWFPKKQPVEHYGTAFHQAAENPSESATYLRPIIGRQSYPAFVRASAAFQLSNSVDQESYQAALKAITDDDPMVVKSGLIRIEMEISRRMGSLTSLDDSPQLRELRSTFMRAAELTGHATRIVRIEAVRVLVAVPRQLRHQWLDADANKSFQKAFDEMIEALLVVKERGGAHRTLGSLYEAVGEVDKAMRHYRTAIVLEPSLQGPRWNLSVLLEQQATDSARRAQQLAQGGATKPAQAEYARAQELFAEAQQLRDQEHDVLLTDLKRLEGIGPADRLHYQIGMSFYRRKDLAMTEKHLLAAYEQRPTNEQYVLALATFYHAKKDRTPALRFVNELLKINSTDPGYRQLKAEIEQL